MTLETHTEVQEEIREQLESDAKPRRKTISQDPCVCLGFAMGVMERLYKAAQPTSPYFTQAVPSMAITPQKTLTRLFPKIHHALDHLKDDPRLATKILQADFRFHLNAVREGVIPETYGESEQVLFWQGYHRGSAHAHVKYRAETDKSKSSKSKKS